MCTNRDVQLTTSKMVRSGLLANWFLAASPTRRSSSVKATQEGVIRLPVEKTCQLLFGHKNVAADLPWSLTKMSTLPFLIIPTQE